MRREKVVVFFEKKRANHGNRFIKKHLSLTSVFNKRSHNTLKKKRAARDEKRHNDARCVIKHARAPARCLLCASIFVLPTHTNIKEKRRELNRRSENGAVFRAEKQRHVGDAKAPTPLANQ